MALRFDHIGVAVLDMAAAREQFRAMFDITAWTREFADAVNQVRVQFGKDASGVCYELISPYGENSPIARALKTGNPILNHVAYRTSDLQQAADHLRGQGCMPAGPANPAIAFGGARIQFLMTPLRFIVELIETNDFQHDYIC